VATAPPRHVIVCGAGVIGASVAYFLSQRGIAVTVIERTGVACAASGKSGGFIALDWCDNSPLGPLARASFALHARLAREIATDYGYRRMDTFMLAAREHGTVPGGHRVPAPPWIDGGAVVAGALGSPDTTAQVHPARFTHALLDGALARGALLRMGRVEGVIQREGVARGSGLSGDPALSMRTPPASSSSFTAAPSSNWQGNPALVEKSGGAHASAVATARPKAPPMSFGAAPQALATYTLPAQAAAPPVVPIAPPGSGGVRSSGPYVGSAFNAAEIQALMAHAGAGCPMGACKGCPHHEVTTGSCGA